MKFTASLDNLWYRWPYGDPPKPDPCPNCREEGCGTRGIRWDYTPEDYCGEVFGECDCCDLQIKCDNRGHYEWLN